MTKKNIVSPALGDVAVTDPLFCHYVTVVSEKLIPYQWAVLNDCAPNTGKSYCVANFRVAAKELAGKHDYIYAAIGVIPHYVGEMTEKDIEDLKKLVAESDKVVAIGEIGLDYYYDEPPKNLQHKWFLRQMELAKELECLIRSSKIVTQKASVTNIEHIIDVAEL